MYWYKLFSELIWQESESDATEQFIITKRRYNVLDIRQHVVFQQRCTDTNYSLTWNFDQINATNDFYQKCQLWNIAVNSGIYWYKWFYEIIWSESRSNATEQFNIIKSGYNISDIHQREVFQQQCSNINCLVTK